MNSQQEEQQKERPKQIGMADFSKPDAFQVRGQLTVQVSCTVMCVRHRQLEKPQTLEAQDILKPGNGSEVTRHPLTDSLFSEKQPYTFTSGWEVLMGQSEVVNWLKSTPEKLQTMRYAGEWKLPGGNKDEGETLEETARRELEEEFLSPMGIQLPEDAVIRPFSVRQTRPIRSRSNIIYNFIALETENPWLKELNIDALNEHLLKKRRAFANMIKSPQGLEKLMDTPKSQRELITPEVHEVKWMKLGTAVRNCISASVPGIFVNEYQETQYARLGKKGRDPMIITGAALVDLEMFDDTEGILDYCSTVELEALRAKEQWLFNGMTADEVKQARVKSQTTRKSVFRTPREIEAGKKTYGNKSKL